MSVFETLPETERIALALRELYGQYGYSQYKMSKFEEYELYVRNKDFLISDSVITFTDTNGKLMALKPDVTLSIIKNSKDLPGCVQKVYYNENVYRVSKGTHSFKEILQTGLECTGDIDDYCLYETLLLAAESLKRISSACVLDISHLGLLSGLLEQAELDAAARAAVLKCIGEKNAHELVAVCREAGVSDTLCEVLRQLTAIYGTPAEVLPRLRALLTGVTDTAPLAQLETVLAALAESVPAEMLRLDLSVISDMKYYSGLVFKGFVEGVPGSVLSGGQYDKLMQKMGKKSGAIGFAVYLDLLERLGGTADRFDVDTVLLYDETAELATLRCHIAALTAEGKTVTAQKRVPEKLRYRQLLQLKNGEVTELENHA